MIFEYPGEEHIANRFCRNFASLMKTTPDNISMTTNTSEAICMIANGYPWQSGDQIVSYLNEYPANHYPWVLQAKHKGVELIQLSDTDIPQESRSGTGPIPDSFARGWSFEELESVVTERTKVIALSHVQFTSGYAADIPRLGAFCKERNIDLVLDAAQSLGSLPVYPEEWGVAAVASAGWKWMLGPVGTGVMYTSPEFREKIEITMTGADHMKQDTAYLDHRWNPHTTGQKFQYSTVAYSVLDGLSLAVEKLHLKYSREEVRDHLFELQELALAQLDLDKYQPVIHERATRSGILSLIPKVSTAPDICQALAAQNIIVTPRDGYIRFAPHICSSTEEVAAGVAALNAIG
jgi:selenocysteine lyase/cysteine desulfurase